VACPRPAPLPANLCHLAVGAGTAWADAPLPPAPPLHTPLPSLLTLMPPRSASIGAPCLRAGPAAWPCTRTLTTNLGWCVAAAQINSLTIPLDITPLEVAVASCGSVKVVWPGDPPHVSYYDPKWLMEHFSRTAPPPATRDPANAKCTRTLFDSTTYSTNADGTHNFPMVPHAEFMEDDAVTLQMLKLVRCGTGGVWCVTVECAPATGTCAVGNVRTVCCGIAIYTPPPPGCLLVYPLFKCADGTLSVLVQLRDHGFVMVEGTPQSTEGTEAVCR
jgi:hypothetical protein